MSTTDRPTETLASEDGIALRPFNQWLLEQRGGLLHGELTQKLAEVVAAAVKTEKNGTLTLKIEVKPEEGGIVFVTDDIKVKVPELRGAVLYHTDEAGNMTRDNPRQTSLPLREVPRAGAAAAGETGGAST